MARQTNACEMTQRSSVNNGQPDRNEREKGRKEGVAQITMPATQR